MILPNEDDTHTEYCKCGKIISDPEAHIWEDSTCTKCYTSHMDHTESEPLYDTPAFGKDGMWYKECTVCHMLLEYTPVDAVTFDTVTLMHNCLFGNDLSMLYAILKSDLADCTDIRLVVEKGHYTGNTPTQVVTKTLYPAEYTIDGKEYYRFDYCEVRAKELGDTLKATLFFRREGADYSGIVDTYSLKQYAQERLSASQDSLYKTLMVELLGYGAAAQEYFGYRTDALVNRDLSEQDLQDFSRDGYDLITGVAENADGTEYAAAITSKNIVFESRIELLVATNLAKDSDLTGISLRIRYTDRLGNEKEKFIESKDFVSRTDVNGYVAYFDGLKASEFRTALELTLVKDGAPISASVKYSLDTYAKNRLEQSTDEAFKKLLEKTLRYSDSAKDYFAKTSK